MNILVSGFPTAVEIDGRAYEINTDFRIGILIMTAFEDIELTNAEKANILLENIYKEIPDNPQKACEMAVKFLDCGEEINETGADSNERVYSFSKDAKYIYSAIKASHNVDLDKEEYLHWWKFSYMFLDLKQDCFFKELIDLRYKKIKGKMSKEDRERYYLIKDIVDLPMGDEGNESEFIRAINGG